MLSEKISTMTQHKPLIPVSSGSSLVFKTGSQRSEWPYFINKVAPCRQACPIGIDIPTAFHLASKGKIDEALRSYLMENPLPGVCGRVCYHPCEVDCNRANFDDAINIRSFERFLADNGSVEPRKDVSATPKEGRIAVVGSGPAGLSAAYHLARQGYACTMFEEKPELGGMLRYGIPSYRLPRSVLNKEIERILSLGIHIQTGTRIGRDLSCSDLDSFDAIFLSVGLQSGKNLFQAEEYGKHILTGLQFLKNPVDWSMENPKQSVLIIGGGNVAIDVGRTLLRLRGGEGHHITIVCPESRDQMPAIPEEVKEAIEEGLAIVNGWAPHEIHGKEGDLNAVDLRRAVVELDPNTGSVKINLVGQEIRTEQADKIVVAIGQELSNHDFPEGIETGGGIISTDQFQRTSAAKIFAGGDAVGGKSFVAQAIASGKMGAFSIQCFLEGRDVETEFQAHQIANSQTFSFQHLIERSENGRVNLKRGVSFDQINTLFFFKSPRINPDERNPETRIQSFEEIRNELDTESMEQEIERCFRCGTCIDCENCLDFCPDISILKDAKSGIYDFDADYCKGCGVCSVACPRNIIEMVRDMTCETS